MADLQAASEIADEDGAAIPLPTAHAPVAVVRAMEPETEAMRELPEEVAVAIVVNGSTHAVLMATPADLEVFGIGFAVTEGLVESANEIERLEIVDQDLGVEVRLWIKEARARQLAERRRAMAGPTGCGLCGIESLEQAIRPVPRLGSGMRFTRRQVLEAGEALRPAQVLNARTHAVHAAALWHPSKGLLAICEDVGRHNALDKLVGTALRDGLDASACALVMTSRVSIELIQKAAMLGTGILIAVSAPTLLAVRMARSANMTLIGIARADGFEIFTHPDRVILGGEASAGRA